MTGSSGAAARADGVFMFMPGFGAYRGVMGIGQLFTYGGRSLAYGFESAALRAGIDLPRDFSTICD
jgi:hypothetical protein